MPLEAETKETFKKMSLSKNVDVNSSQLYLIFV
jgi:hypothetical protein